MTDDPEQQLYRDVSELREQIPKFHSEVRSLKTRLGKLKNRLDGFELIDFQGQITSLDSKVTRVDSILLRLDRNVAKSRIRLDLFWAHWSLTPINNINSKDCIRFAREEASASLAEINTSQNPHQIAEAWFSRCADYFRKHGGFETFG